MNTQLTSASVPLIFPRRGAWAMHGKTVGVIHDIQGNVGEFHAVNEDGETTEVVAVPLEDLTQATRPQIPAVRRPSAKAAERFGYKEK